MKPGYYWFKEVGSKGAQPVEVRLPLSGAPGRFIMLRVGTALWKFTDEVEGEWGEEIKEGGEL